GAVLHNRTAVMPKTTQNYDPEFRRNAVNLLLSSGRPLNRVAEELGITANSLRTWRDRAIAGGGGGAEAAPGKPEGRSEAPGGGAAEIRRLQKEVEYLKRQREILKKAMGILSEDSRNGMP